MREAAIYERITCICALLITASLALVACGDEPSKRPLPSIPPAGAGGPPHARAVGFRAGDGVGLRGRLFGHGRAAVVLAHMGNLPDNESDWYPLARRLAREGYLVLAYNRRAVCTGEKRKYDCSGDVNDFGKSWRDVVGAARFVQSQGAAALISLAGVNHASTYSMVRADLQRIGAPSCSSAPAATPTARPTRRAS